MEEVNSCLLRSTAVLDFSVLLAELKSLCSVTFVKPWSVMLFQYLVVAASIF